MNVRVDVFYTKLIVHFSKRKKINWIKPVRNVYEYTMKAPIPNRPSGWVYDPNGKGFIANPIEVQGTCIFGMWENKIYIMSGPVMSSINDHFRSISGLIIFRVQSVAQFETCTT